MAQKIDDFCDLEGTAGEVYQWPLPGKIALF
jgi:hypothetical protein